MSPEINFIATFGTSITNKFDRSLEAIGQHDLAEAAENHLDSLTEEELRNLYRNGVISIDDPHEPTPTNSTGN